MKKQLIEKMKEAFASVLPITLIVLLLNFTPLVALSATEVVAFSVSAVMMIVGIGLFSLGADVSMTPMGEKIGFGLTKSKRVWLLLAVAFALGLFITIAEPDLSVLAEQVSSAVEPTLLIGAVGVGVGLFLLLAVLRILFRADLSQMLTFFYLTLFAVTALLAESNVSLIPLSFDSGGVTTGPVTVPFIMALGVGVSGAIGGKKSGENSFGLVALCSIGPMLAVALLCSFSSAVPTLPEPDYGIADAWYAALPEVTLGVVLNVLKALGLIVAFFMVLQFTVLKLPVSKLKQIFLGLAFTFVGLVLFLVAVEVGFIPVGYKIGGELAHDPVALTLLGGVLGAVVVFAEPAVKVLNKQVEEITGGMVKKSTMLIALALGVGSAIALSLLRVLLGFSLLYFIIPGYILSLGLSFFVPKIYTAIAFDSGGVASGPLTSGFILPLVIGACVSINGSDSILSLAFGVVAMVAMAPLITIQALGFRAIFAAKVRENVGMRRILAADDEQIISFM